MKQEKNGFAISSILYMILLLFLTLLFGILGMLGARKIVFDKAKREIIEDLDKSSFYEFSRSFNFVNDVQTFIVPKDGNYQIELWGARGGNIHTYLGGNGAYTKGTIALKKGEILYVYVGGAGSDSTNVGGYNGGGSIETRQIPYGRAGGGATDIRLIGGNWDDFDSLKSRIMVAAGGGGADDRNSVDQACGYGQGNGGYGGTLAGGAGETINHTNAEGCTWGFGTAMGGTNTAGGTFEATTEVVQNTTEATDGSFGKGGDEQNGSQTGGGAGYYGGAGGLHGGAGGGSSFISGYPGCDAIAQSSTETNITHTMQAKHYSGRVFSNMIMKAGNEAMPNPQGVDEMIGNNGNGFARITYVP